MTIETGHGDSGLLDGAAQDGDDVDEGAEDDELRPDRTEKTKAAAEAFLRRLAERQDPTSDEVEQGLEGQVFSLFGRQPANRYSTDDDIKNEGEDGHHDTGVASEVETKVTSMLREQPAEPARQGPMIEVRNVRGLHASFLTFLDGLPCLFPPCRCLMGRKDYQL